MLGGFYDGGKFDDTSYVTLQDEFPWHEVGVNKYTQRIPATIVPALLQSVTDVSPSRSSLDREEDEFHEVDEDSSVSGDVVPRYSVAQKGKWKARKDDHVSRRLRSPSLQFHFDSVSNVSLFMSLVDGAGSNSHRCSLLRTGSSITDQFCKITLTARRRCP